MPRHSLASVGGSILDPHPNKESSMDSKITTWEAPELREEIMVQATEIAVTGSGADSTVGYAS